MISHNKKQKQVLHVGCGPKRKKQMPKDYHDNSWNEIRLDIDPSVNPDVVATIMDMPEVENSSVDAVWSSHNIEHLYWHDVPTAFAEFFRVIRPGGFVHITCPDIMQIAELILKKGSLCVPIYQSNAGPVSSMDVLYGHGKSMSQGNLFMSHKCGFTGMDLGRILYKAGFRDIRIEPDKNYNLWAKAYKLVDTP